MIKGLVFVLLSIALAASGAHAAGVTMGNNENPSLGAYSMPETASLNLTDSSNNFDKLRATCMNWIEKKYGYTLNETCECPNLDDALITISRIVWTAVGVPSDALDNSEAYEGEDDIEENGIGGGVGGGPLLRARRLGYYGGVGTYYPSYYTTYPSYYTTAYVRPVAYRPIAYARPIGYIPGRGIAPYYRPYNRFY